MTRINSILFALLVGLLGAGLFFLLVYVDGPDRLSQIAIPALLITAASWFMAQRVATKPRSEQAKQRWAALGVMLIILAGYMFMDYKNFETGFINSCERSTSIYTCECLEESVGLKLWSQQVQERPQVALGKDTMSAVMRRINTANRERVQSAIRNCNRR